MYKPEISVIVPVYKVEKYLDRCVKSILNQSFKDFELLLVDDGSPDSCGEICESYCRQDSRIKVFHKENGGLSDARNYGTQRAAGSFITFIDSDDYVSSDYLEVLIGMIKKYNADVAVGNYMDVSDENPLICQDNKKNGEEKTFDTDGALHQLLASPSYLQMETAWGKLIQADIARKHLFPYGRFHEDEATTYLFYVDSETVAVTDRVLYGYYQNPASIMRSERNEKRIGDALWAMADRAENLERLGKIEASKAAWLFVYGWLLEDVMINPKERWKWKETYRKLQNAKYVKYHIKEKAFAYMHFPYMFGKLQKIRGKD